MVINLFSIVKNLSASLLLVLLTSHHGQCEEGDELETLMSSMEADALALAREIERAYAGRCLDESIAQCNNGSYDSCVSEFPEQSCPGGNVFARPSCGDGVTCGGLFDFTTTSVRIAEGVEGGLGVDDTPLGRMAKEAVCYSLQAQDYFVKKFEEDIIRRQGVDGGAASAMFFGSDTTVFRRIPAVQDSTCGGYDTTRRPWYVAATSGPKDVVLVLDMAGTTASARKGSDVNLVKAAATRIVETLTVGDHVAIVTLNSDSPNLAGGSTLVQATRENKALLLETIDSLETTGPRNFTASFEKTYEILEESRINEQTSFCHKAVIFLTDGDIGEEQGFSEDAAVERIQYLHSNAKPKPYVFLYSLGFDANLPVASNRLREIACRIGGMSAAATTEQELATTLSGYYKLFSLGLGQDVNENFVAWVDPYPYSTGNVNGTTVSAPVYDRSVSPPILLGSVGIDFTMAAMDKALGVHSGSRKTLERLVQRSTAICPELSLNECEIQSLRFVAGGEDALCPAECTDFVAFTPTPCNATTNYPEYFWKNSANKNRTYPERVCCSVGETRIEGEYTLEEIQSQVCTSNGEPEVQTETVATDNTAQTVGVAIASMAGVIVLCFSAALCSGKIRQRP